MLQIKIRPVRDYNKGVGDKSIVAHELVVISEDVEMLESLKGVVETMFMRCESCKGEVVRSGKGYLCLSSCGHVAGEPNDGT